MATNRPARARTRDRAPREPLPHSLPRPVKRRSGRTAASHTPAHVRVIGGTLEDDDRLWIRQTVATKLGKFASSIERVTVRVTDANGPRGGIDQVGSAKIVLSGLPSVIVERHDSTVHAAVDAALRASAEAVGRRLRRRRTKPMRDRN